MPVTSLSHFYSQTFLNDNQLEQSLGEEFCLCENGNMIFHWADFHETCDAIKEALGNNESLKKDFERKEQGLARLAHIPVWIRTHSKVHQTTMFDLYERYILNQSSHLGIDPFGQIEISFISGTGPFKAMAITECFNKSTYKDFIVVNLLREKLPKRDFRIRLKAKILMEYGQELTSAHLIHFEQITANGILLSMDSDMYFKDVAQSEKIRIIMDTQVLKEAIDKNLQELQNHLSQYTFNLLYSSKKSDGIECFVKDFSVQSSFDFFRNKKAFLFISFKDLGKSHPQSVKAMQGFVAYSKELVRAHYKEMCEKLKTA